MQWSDYLLAGVQGQSYDDVVLPFEEGGCVDPAYGVCYIGLVVERSDGESLLKEQSWKI